MVSLESGTQITGGTVQIILWDGQTTSQSDRPLPHQTDTVQQQQQGLIAQQQLWSSLLQAWSLVDSRAHRSQRQWQIMHVEMMFTYWILQAPTYHQLTYAFNKAKGDNLLTWSSALGTYSTSYLGRVSTRYDIYKSYRGEWLQIQLPVSIILHSYQLTSCRLTGTNAGCRNRVLVDWLILGSTNGSVWFSLDHPFSNPWLVLLGGETQTFYLPSNKARHNYYHICVGRTFAVSSLTGIDKWRLMAHVDVVSSMTVQMVENSDASTCAIMDQTCQSCWAYGFLLLHWPLTFIGQPCTRRETPQ